jgi:hypothetical protein
VYMRWSGSVIAREQSDRGNPGFKDGLLPPTPRLRQTGRRYASRSDEEGFYNGTVICMLSAVAMAMADKKRRLCQFNFGF